MVSKRPRPNYDGNNGDGGPSPEPAKKRRNGKASGPWKQFPPKQRAFLAALSRTYRITEAARIAKIHPATPLQWRKTSHAFRLAMEQAKKIGADHLESEAVRRAVQGVPRKKFHRGDPVIDPETRKQYVEYVYSDYLMGKLLEAAKPNKYRQRAEVQQRTVITTDAPQPGQGLAAFFRDRLTTAQSTVIDAPVITHQIVELQDGNGQQHHDGNGQGGNGQGGNGQHE
jgi:hypothetical protein